MEKSEAEIMFCVRCKKDFEAHSDDIASYMCPFCIPKDSPIRKKHNEKKALDRAFEIMEREKKL